MEDYNIAFYTLGITLSASACAWVANVLYTQYEFMKSNRVNRYKDALSEFYWPLYIRLTELLAYTNKNGDCELQKSKITECALATMDIVRDKIGMAMPKKHIAQPLCELVAMLAAGLRHDNPTEYLNMDILRRIEIIVKSRLISMQRKYDAIVHHADDKGTSDMYEMAIEELRAYLSKKANGEIPGYVPPKLSLRVCLSSKIKHCDRMRDELLRLFEWELNLPQPHREEHDRSPRYSIDEERPPFIQNRLALPSD